ncbi:hypothetical protein [Streptomyces caniscabiei]|uniref:hypothetical protein n=1 Tax=Streptomyces caniscabiei TaxID=2746961 RepID=UPI00187315A1|nr:hypothetical protein [Streptomyces caniscabiei]MBE4783918.1 hypothetical protein [Streptomyces caniscabiei]MBE4791583.1 hypothetical protein [Streptomyces caniscabiei]MDX3009180.1 hypothetical protein [Streptomyces caniscabiei]
MQKRTLPRLAGAGWVHPYGHGPFAPWYADGGDGDGSGSNDGGGDDSGTGDDDGQDDDGAGGTGDDDGQDDAGKDSKPKPKPPARKDDGEDTATTIARLQKELKTANADAAKARTTAKKNAADEARTEIVQELGKALGLIKDDKDTPPDPAALTARIEQATAAHRETAVELAVYRGASKFGADPDALTDSRAFLNSIKGLDPSDEGFAKAVQAAIKKAVDDNPKLKAQAPAPARTSGDFSGGTGGRPKDDSIEAHREARRKARGG